MAARKWVGLSEAPTDPDTQADQDALEVLERGLTTPAYLVDAGLQLTNPQLLAVEQLTSTKRGILSLDKGMGKTLTYLVAAYEAGATKLVILCTKNAMSAQLREIGRYFPRWQGKTQIVMGQRPQRQKQWSVPADIFITTPATYMADAGFRKGGSTTPIMPKWALSPEVLIEDEFHRYMRNKTSGIFQMQKKLVKADMLIPSSGSSVSKGPQDIWPALHLLDRKTWSSYWSYVYQYCEIDEGGYGRTIIGVKNTASWRRIISDYMFHRRKSLKDYPPKMREFLCVDMDAEQKKIHDELRDELLAEVPNDPEAIILARNSLEALYKLRVLLICPRALHPSLGYGAGLQGILDDVQESELQHFVVSTPFVKPIEHIVAFFASHGIRCFTLTGAEGLSPTEMDERIRTWTALGGAIIQTHKYAQSYELLAAKNVYSLGYEFDPEDNAQAEDRLHRLSAEKDKAINCWYVKCNYSYDDDILNIVLGKSHNTRLLLGDR